MHPLPVHPLTVVHVSTQRGWHGGEEQARLLVRGLAACGHRSVILARREGQFAPRMRSEGFEVLPLGGSGRGPAAIWHSRQALRKLRPDVIHFHDTHALSGTGAAAWGLPIGARIASRRVDFSVRSRWPYRHFVDCVITVSQAVAEVCRASGLDGRRVRVVHDGVDPKRIRRGDRARGRAALQIGDHQSLLLCVARLSDYKGHAYLLDAMPEILAQCPQARLALAGDGELRGALEAQARRLKIAHAIWFLGYRNDVPDLLKAADLFVMPSHSEGLCSTLIDAMLARVPIVTTYAGGIPEVVGGRHRKESPVARLVAPRDPAALAGAVLDGLHQGATLQSQINRAEARAERLFTAQQMVDGTLAVYQEVLEAAASPLAAVRAA